MYAPKSCSILFLALALLIGQYCFSQVGIGTKTPRKTLEIAGDAEISGNVEIGVYKSLGDADTSTFLVQETDGTIKSLDVSNPTGAALGYIQEYVITNMEEDWVRNFDTGIDATDFTVIVTSASFDRELDITESNDAPDNSSLPYTATFVEAGTWRIIADYPMAANAYASEIGTWVIKTLIFSNDLSKQFGSIDVFMSDGSIGTAITPVID
ncbi:MAG: hypothetical protein KJO23_06870 [Bacteroidia bacterium]|nr:hypothetical protein [Bacteroidia bacterium]NNM22301.1 hypothetical protein [Flavobacteriaceae bacterium]